MHSLFFRLNVDLADKYPVVKIDLILMVLAAPSLLAPWLLAGPYKLRGQDNTDVVHWTCVLVAFATPC